MQNKEASDVINCKLGKACVSGMVSSGYAFIALSVLPIFTFEIIGYIGSIALFLFGSFLAFSTTGVSLNLKNKKLNNYVIYFNIIKTRNWIDINKFVYVTVLVFNKEEVIYSRSNRSTSQSNKKYEVYLLDESKLDRQIVTTFIHAKSAIDFAKEIAIKLDKEYIIYYLDKGWES